MPRPGADGPELDPHQHGPRPHRRSESVRGRLWERATSPPPPLTSPARTVPAGRSSPTIKNLIIVSTSGLRPARRAKRWRSLAVRNLLAALDGKPMPDQAKRAGHRWSEYEAVVKIRHREQLHTNFLIGSILDGDRVVDELERRSVVDCLGTGVDANGRVTRDAMERVYSMLDEFKQKIEAGAGREEEDRDPHECRRGTRANGIGNRSSGGRTPRV